MKQLLITTLLIILSPILVIVLIGLTLFFGDVKELEVEE